MTTNSFPENFAIIGSVVSAVVAPPAEMGANLPNHITSKGAKSNVKSSRIMFDINAITPISAPLNSVIKILDKE